MNKYNFISTLIPLNVLKDNNISFSEKLLLIHIISLCKNKGYCWATNKYFCDIYNVSKQTISKHINKLIKCNYIHAKYSKHNINIDKRKISLTEALNAEIKSIQDKLNTSSKDSFHTSIKNNFNQ